MYIPGTARYGIWLRANSVSGGKEWLGFLTDCDVVSQWGKSGQVNQNKTICSAPSRIFLDRKIQEKKSKGYRLVGEWFPGSGWTHQQQNAPAPSPDQQQPNVTNSVTAGVLKAWLSNQDSEQWF